MNSNFNLPRVLDCTADAFDQTARSSRYRFVIVAVQHPSEGELIFLRVGLCETYEEHISLVEALNREIIHYTRGVLQCRMRCLGGGFLRIDSPRHEITVYGSSGRYQKELERETRTAPMLQELFSGFRIEVDPK